MGPGLHLRQGLRVGGPRVARALPADRAARGAGRRAEVARRRRVRALDRRRGLRRARAPRKRREWEIDRAIREGRADEIEGLVRIVAPRGRARRRPRHPHLAAPGVPAARRDLRCRRPLPAPARRRPGRRRWTRCTSSTTPSSRSWRWCTPTAPRSPTRLPRVDPRARAARRRAAHAAARLGHRPGRSPPTATPSSGWCRRCPRVRGARCYALALEWSHEVAGLAPARRLAGDPPGGLAAARERVRPAGPLRHADQPAAGVRRVGPARGRALAAAARRAPGRPARAGAWRRPVTCWRSGYGADGAEESERDVPPDIVLSAAAEASQIAEHHVIARAPVLARHLGRSAGDRPARPADPQPDGLRPDRRARAGSPGCHRRRRAGAPGRRHRAAVDAGRGRHRADDAGRPSARRRDRRVARRGGPRAGPHGRRPGDGGHPARDRGRAAVGGRRCWATPCPPRWSPRSTWPTSWPARSTASCCGAPP